MLKMQTKSDQNKTIFNIFDIDADNKLSILDLNWLSSRFTPVTKFG